MEGNIGTKVTGIYHVELTDSITGEVKQSGVFHNMPTYEMLNLLMGGVVYQYSNCFLQLGTSKTAPSYTNNGCISSVFNVSQDSTTQSSYVNDHTYKTIKKFVYPATSSYVSNNISEASVYMNCTYSATGNTYARYLTRCLFTDSEGNVITFNKTALDILTVTVEITVTIESSSDSFYLYKNLRMLKQAFDCTRNSYRFCVNLLKYKNDKNYLVRNYGNIKSYSVGSYLIETVSHSNETDGTTSSTLPWKYSFNNSNRTSSYAREFTIRIPNTTITSETYYKGMSFDSIGCILLPDEGQFPTYKIENVQVGIGDGVTSQFTNPFSYFKEGTEVIKIDGEILDKNAYTINHMGNKNKHLNLLEDNEPITSIPQLKKDDSVWSSCGYLFNPMFRPSCAYKRYISEINTEKDCFGINIDNPVVLDYGEEKTFNFLKGLSVRLIRKQKNNNAYSFTTSSNVIYVDYSSDGQDWIEAGNGTISGTTINISFENPITSRYWRIRTNLASSDSTYYNILAIVGNETNESNNGMYTEEGGIAFGFYDPYIVFVDAPAESSVITMDVEMDLMMKNENYAMDIRPALNFKMNLGE